MACPNKKEDERIIAEVARRKAIKANKVDEQPSYSYMVHTWEGSLFHLQWLGIDESTIESIRRVGENMWEATIKV